MLASFFVVRYCSLMYLVKKIFLIEIDFCKERVIHSLFLNFRGACVSRFELNLENVQRIDPHFHYMNELNSSNLQIGSQE